MARYRQRGPGTMIVILLPVRWSRFLGEMVTS